MPNKVNLLEFQDVLKRSTLNFSIDNVKMTFGATTYKVGMRSSNAIVILRGENKVISGISDNDVWELMFSDPQRNVKSYFDLIIPDENDEADIQMKNEKIIVKSGKQKSNLFFCDERVTTRFDGDGPRTMGDEIFSIDISQDFVDTYNLVKKVASGFKKIYFNVEDGEVSVESTDKTNTYSNGMKMQVGTSEYEGSVSVCFDYKTFNNVMTLLNGDAEDFQFRIGYIEQSQGGMASFIRKDESEKYFIMTSREN